MRKNQPVAKSTTGLPGLVQNAAILASGGNPMSRSPRVDLLIVDNDTEFRELLLRRFEHAGFAVQDAPNGKDALQFAQQRHFAAAIFEMHLPDMSGLELLEEFKALDADCEVIFLTGYDCIDAADQAMHLGAFRYLLKPCSLAEVEGHIREGVERRRAQQATSLAIDEDSPDAEVVEKSGCLPAA